MNLIAPDIKAEHLDLLQRALLEDLQLLCLYQSANKNRVHELTLNPLALVQRGQITYLVACADTFDDVRLYAVHRFETVTIKGQPSRRPVDFDLPDYIQSGAMQFGISQAIQLRAWVDPALSKRLRETPLSEDMTLIVEPEGARLSATVNDSWELKWWLLSQAGAIRVDEPTTLRQALIDCQRQSLALHDTPI
ncbi:WYL domain-containing protein [Pseudomonas extremaustralis]|uniref:WYL domain-containing protein n=1 Tax=Pseudomonas extremaustralis TaxID=359110 RepID=UPI000AF52CEB|nr:WYL domain-containing protein [Pseudomonas extremaustralis]